MAPKKDATPQKGKGSTSRKGKGKEQVREQAPPSNESDPDYNVEDDLPLFEGPFEYTLQVTSSKRKKSSSMPSIFVEEAAQERWEQGMAMKLLHLKRGFAIDEGPFQPIMEFHKFDKKLTAAPAYCNARLAREFYANAKFPDKDGAYFVRGMRVQITSEIINAHLGTSSYPSDPLHYPKNADQDDALLHELALPGEEWVLNKRGAHLHVRCESLKNDVKIWQKFVVSRLQPSTQTTEVNRNRLFLLSAIIGRRSIDAGRIIHACITSGIELDSAALYFPVLLEEICAAQGVDVQAGDWRPNPGPIGTSLYLKYVRNEKELLRAHLATQGAYTQGIDGSGNYTQQVFNFQDFQGAVHGLQQSMDAGFRHMDERMESMNEQGDDRYQDLVRRMDGLSSRMDGMSSITQQQFEVLYHRQMMMHAELDKCNKMAVYYHSSPELPKLVPTHAQLTGCQVPNLSSNVVSGEVHEIPPGAAAVPSFGLLPTFGSLSHMPTPPMISPNPAFMPSTRIPFIASGQQIQGSHLGLSHWTAPPFSGASFSTSATFSPSTIFVPPSS